MTELMNGITIEKEEIKIDMPFTSGSGRETIAEPETRSAFMNDMIIDEKAERSKGHSCTTLTSDMQTPKYDMLAGFGAGVKHFIDQAQI